MIEQQIAEVNGIINSFIWGPIMCIVFVCVGVLLSVRTGLFQVTKVKLWWSGTIMAIFNDKSTTASNEKHSISQFQALTTALASTIGTGNIVGVSTALVSGGPGAIFWMWVSAFFGMMTKYAEIVLSMKYRYKNEKGQWQGGPMAFIERGLNNKVLASLFALFCILASFGIGNMSQANSISSALSSTFGINKNIVAILIIVLVAVVIMGGIKRIAKVTEMFVPFMASVYIIGGIILIIMNFSALPEAFSQIFEGAFRVEAAGGGILGYTIQQSMRYGVARGVFSNEAGLGSSSMAHAATNTKEPVKQAVWGIFEVFADTFIVCSITALAIISSGVIGSVDGQGELIRGAELTILAFSQSFGGLAGIFISFAITLFAFSTILGWSYYGERSVEYLFGMKYTIVYKIIFVLMAGVGCISSLSLVWDLSDTFNGLMALPNLIALVLLSGEVSEMTKEYTKKVKFEKQKSY